jgi:hypothetical protein
MAAYSNLMEAMTISNTQPAAGLDLKLTRPLTTERQSHSELSSQATGYIHEKPLAGIAFAAGFLISQLYKK